MADEIMKMYPEDVMMYILTRIQVKSLLRLKCVSKTWCALINSSTFIHFHLNRTTTTKDELILFKRSFREGPDEYKSIMSFLFDVDEQIDHKAVFPDLVVPYLTTTSSCMFHRLLGPCNGLIVLTDSRFMVLFNPTTRNYRLLEADTYNCPFGFYQDNSGVGFGFDWIVNNYKIVSVSEIIGDPPFYDFHFRKWKVDVYDLITDSWRNVNNINQQMPKMHWYACSELYFKGAVHWIASDDAIFVVLCFDVCTEIFRSILMPDGCDYFDGKCYGIVILHDFLTLVCYPDPGNDIRPGKESTDVWLLKEYGINKSWVKKYYFTAHLIESPITIWRDHVLFLQTQSGVLISGDLHNQQVKEYDHLQGFPRSLRIAVYKESLTPIPKRSQLCQPTSNV
uniref:S-locus F-box protein type-1 n=1 Tax=Solanum peruvianum TaxID=4082 RepID=A0A2D0W2C8_SOLPE|nr:S-locus F-box protein type-1 [Solanum peruvianum]